jgi:hypothetical protein
MKINLLFVILVIFDIIYLKEIVFTLSFLDLFKH